ncbi:hypothetical protein N7517_001871 [Penicillium concentricum]|uniref:Uncharacterized protein n=1 Tax=Penicillium concentricum TaxID=293559 RepID=A0A9W9SSX3_9EURO|nr:uncharacterized protein N7517_001871 [Penicillium concentricum]KAJ5383960.1 hypothetical protein N7517_001871 [Penicillium concentricum]
MEADGEPLNDVMLKISSGRRQTYANLMKSATVTIYNRKTEGMVQPALEDVFFPKLHTLRLVLRFYDLDTGEESIRVPTLNMPNLQTLHVDRWARPSILYPAQWDNLTDRILKLFPNLSNVRIEIPAILYIAESEALSENLPNLESIQFEKFYPSRTRKVVWRIQVLMIWTMRMRITIIRIDEDTDDEDTANEHTYSEGTYEE